MKEGRKRSKIYRISGVKSVPERKFKVKTVK